MFERVVKHFDEHSLRGAEKLVDFLRDVLNALLDPSTMSEYREAGMVDAHEAERLLARVMRARREADLLVMQGASDEDVLNVYKAFWEECQEDVRTLFSRLADGWRARGETRSLAEYFG